MSVQSPFIFPLRGIGRGVTTYELRVDDAFFASFPDAPIERADVDLTLNVDRRGGALELHFAFSGTVATVCDRCTAPIDLPINDEQRLVVKFDVDADLREDEGDLVYLHPDTNLLNVAPYVYEMVVLAVPMIRTYACREGAPPYPCDEDLLARIDGSVDHAPADDEAANGDNDEDAPSPWDVLKDLN